MKDIFIGWIIFQLVLIGVSVIAIHNQIVDKTFECGLSTKVSDWKGAFIPLAAFIPESKELLDYCYSVK